MNDPFNDVYKRCNSGTNAEKYADLPRFPDMLDIELTNTCQLRCPFCPTGRRELTRKRGMMKKSTFFKIIKEIRTPKTPIRLIRWGEPMLHKRFWEFVALAKYYDIPVHVNTGGHFFDDHAVECANFYKLDSIKISIHEDSNAVMDAVKRLERLKFTHTHVSITTDERGLDIYDAAKVDKKSRLKTYWKGITYPRPSCCSEALNKLSVNWDGSVSACCTDFNDEMLVGNLKDNTLKEIWEGPKMKGYQRLIAEDLHWTLPLCSECYDLSLRDK